MIDPMTKIQIAAPTSDKEGLLQFLQEEEVVHVSENVQRQAAALGGASEAGSTAYQLARVQFALDFIKRIRKELNVQKKRSFKTMFSPKPMAKLQELEAVFGRLGVVELVAAIKKTSEALVELEANIQTLKTSIDELVPWENLQLRGSDTRLAAPVIHRLLVIYTRDEEKFMETLLRTPSVTWQEVHRVSNKNGVHIYGELVAHASDANAVAQCIEDLDAETVEMQLAEGESLVDRLNALRAQVADLEGQYQATLHTAQSFLKHEKDLQFSYDALLHRLERETTQQHLTASPFTVVLTGWVPTRWLATFTQRLSKTFPSAAVETISHAADEKPPVALVNKPLMRPFEAVTNIYGKPGYHEIDPSGALSIFFLLSFGLALTDAGYGLVMMAATFAAEKFFRLKREMRKMMRLLFYAGAFTVVLGAMAGGWFGVVLEDMSEGPLKNILLSMKLIDPVAEPMKLLGVVFALGIVQLLFAWVVRGYSHWKSGQIKDIYLDDIPWITMVVFLLLWVAAGQGIVAENLRPLLGWLTIGNAGYLVLTQGRAYKNPFIKIGSGAISLYGLISFMSDTLSYSRLLALGLATGIIGLVVNLMASMVSSAVPVVGLILGAIVLLIGHTFNLGINALGAFIHSGRLQFVEFFPKFIEGGGMPYKPFGRVSKYVDNPKEFT